MIKNKKGSGSKDGHNVPTQQDKGAGRVIIINDSAPSTSAGKNKGESTITQSCATPPRPTGGNGK